VQAVALARLAQVVAALAPEPPDVAGADGGSGGEGQQPNGLPRGDATALAELKLLRLMQEEVNRRTAEIQTQQLAGGMTPQLEQESLELAAEQGRLADLMLNLSRPSVENPEDDPASLPDAPTQEKNGKDDSVPDPLPPLGERGKLPGGEP
jgi:hypothetical protein